jgi:hypothetical protein
MPYSETVRGLFVGFDSHALPPALSVPSLDSEFFTIANNHLHVSWDLVNLWLFSLPQITAS